MTHPTAFRGAHPKQQLQTPKDATRARAPSRPGVPRRQVDEPLPRLTGRELFAHINALDENTFAEALKAPDKWLALGVTGRVFVPDQAKQLCLAMSRDGFHNSYRQTHLLNRADVIAALALHCPALAQHRDELVQDVLSFEQPMVDAALAVATSAPLHELRDPDYAHNIYAPTAACDIDDPGTCRLTIFARAALGRQVTSLQLREILGTFLLHGRTESLRHLVLYWNGQGDLDDFRGLFPDLHEGEAQRLLSRPPTAEEHASLGGAFGEWVSQMLASTVELRPEDLEQHLPDTPLNSFQVRYLVSLVRDTTKRPAALDLVLPRWDRHGDAQLILDAFPEKPMGAGGCLRKEAETKLEALP